MRISRPRAVFVLLLLLAGCAAPGPRFGTVAAGIPPVPPGQVRIFLYRWLEPYETVAPTAASLNGVTVGYIEPGAVVYRDVPPGTYTIAVKSEGIYPDQFKSVALRPGEIAFARVESIRSWQTCGFDHAQGCGDTFVVNVVDPAVAHAEMQNLRLTPG
jgi:hypothetical protein